MFKSAIKQVFRLFGFEVRRPATDSSNASSMAPFVTQRKLLTDADHIIIFDVGASQGQAAKRYNLMFPEALIYSFEPLPESFEALSNYALGHANVKPFQLAIAESRGEKSLYVNERRDTSSLFPRPRKLKRYYPADAETINKIHVEATTLDEFYQESSILKIHILKMDIQGGELSALRGATTLLSENRISIIFTEVMFVPHYEDAPLFYEICEFLAKYDYTLYDIFPVYHASNGQLRQGDAIFVSRTIRNEVVNCL